MMIALVMSFSNLRPAVSAPSAPGLAISPNNAAILYVGRWDKTDASVYHSYWGGAYLRVNFTGASAAIVTTDRAGLIVSIDEETPRRVAAGVGQTDLTAAPLKPGKHTLLVGSARQSDSVLLSGLVFDADSAVTAPMPRPIIEFIGDSITAFGGPEEIPVENYAWNTAEALGCDHTQIANSSKALTTGYGCLSDKSGLDVQYFRSTDFSSDSTTSWNMSTYVPSIVVINLGQYDQCGNESPLVLSASLTGFVQKIRTQFPLTHIVVLRPFSGAYGPAEQDATRNLMFNGDNGLLFVDTTTWLQPGDFVDGIQPNEVGRLKILSRLAPILRSLLPPA